MVLPYFAVLAVLIIIAALVGTYLLVRHWNQRPEFYTPEWSPPPRVPVLSGPDPMEVSLVEYNRPDLIPSGLRPVAFVTSTVVPDHIVRVTDSWFASKDIAPASRICWGAVKYATYDLVPAYMRAVGSAILVIAGPPVPITDGRSLKFNDKTNSMHLATAGV